MSTIAEQFEQMGDKSLMESLVGAANENPILVWHQDLIAAQGMIQRGRSFTVYNRRNL